VVLPTVVGLVVLARQERSAEAGAP
jgi:hypothetical protein